MTLRYTGTSAWLQINDKGQETTVTTLPAEPVIRVSQPLRNGQQWLQAKPGMEVVVARVEHTRAAGRVRLTLHCSPSAQLDEYVDWLRRLSLLDAKLNSPSDQAPIPQTLAGIIELATVAPDDASRALVLHYQAVALQAQTNPKQAILEYGLAEKAWLALGEQERAVASRMGRIETEFDAGDATNILDETTHLADPRAAVSYFTTRMENTRCIVLEDLGRFDESIACYEWTLSALKRLDERPEYASTLRNLANLQRKLGNLVMAKRLASQALDFASGPSAPMTRGRLHGLLSGIASQQGDLATAIAQTELAAGEFDKAEFGALLWRVAARLYQATLLEQIGSYHEARFALGMATNLLATGNLRSQLAQSAKIFSDLEADAGDIELASFWSHASEQAYADMGAAPARDVVHLVRLQFQEQHGDYAEVTSALTEKHDALILYQPQWQLLFAGLALHQNRLADAQSLLVAVREKPLALNGQLRYASLQAEYLERSGDIPGAQTLLVKTAQRLQVLAAHSGNEALRDLIARQQLPLQRSAYSLALRHAGTSDEPVNVQMLWSWLAMTGTNSAVARREKANEKGAESFDRAVAAELLLPASQKKPAVDALAQRELLSLLAQPSDDTDPAIFTSHAFPLASVQQHLDADSALIAYLDGDSRGGLLWITHDDVRLLDAAAPEDVRTSIAALREALRSPNSSVAEIQSAAQTLSTQLLHGVPSGAAPKHLFVLADEMTPRIAWSVLTWPEQTRPLLDTTTVELVRLDNADTPGTLNDAAPLHVIVASQQVEGDAKLASLATASAEPQLIQTALSSAATLGQHPLLIADGSAATRETVLSALGEPGAWVHIAAHGTAQPQRIGYAGLWLEPSGADKSPAFLSWLDILDKGVRADLVVLNACQLGDSGNAINGNLSFAAAVSRAGARQVVAALWPVSDSAAALWVPTFYSTLAGDPDHNAAAALRAAQLRLRASRAFTHPFFWAGMQATSRLSLPVSASSHAPIASRQRSGRLH